ncbi:MAG: flavodoxin family protein, partial [Clostridia bacterium]|nr:flavodoxin family protein [Clostridia bacterium]
VIDRFYSAAYPVCPPNLKKVAMILSSGDCKMYDGALFSFKGDFLDYLGLENMGVYTAHGYENGSDKKLKELEAFGQSLK